VQRCKHDIHFDPDYQHEVDRKVDQALEQFKLDRANQRIKEYEQDKNDWLSKGY